MSRPDEISKDRVSRSQTKETQGQGDRGQSRLSYKKYLQKEIEKGTEFEQRISWQSSWNQIVRDKEE
jgi:hypothetical protein